MKQKLLALFLLVATNRQLSAQITTDANGNVGIGTTTPQHKLHIFQQEGLASDVLYPFAIHRGWSAGSTTPRATGILFKDINSIQASIQAIRINSYADYKSGLGFFVNKINSSSLVPTTALSEAMRINSNGYLGIGNTMPEAPLTIGDLTPGQVGQGEAIHKGSIQIQGAGGDISSPGGLEFKTASVAGGWGWRIAAPDYYEANTPLVFHYRTGSANWSEAIRIKNNGHLGIGTTNPLNKLSVQGSNAMISVNSSVVDAETVGLQFLHLANQTTDYRKVAILSDAVGSYGRGNLHFAVNTNLDWTNVSVSDAKLTINGTTGNVGIGTTNPGTMKLAVAGTIGARKVMITQASPWPDYVFENSYSLRPLEKLEKFINQNKHLPDVPSASEVEKDGLDVGSTQAILLKKIEELTLYLLAQDKENKSLKRRVEMLESKTK